MGQNYNFRPIAQFSDYRSIYETSQTAICSAKRRSKVIVREKLSDTSKSWRNFNFDPKSPIFAYFDLFRQPLIVARCGTWYLKVCKISRSLMCIGMRNEKNCVKRKQFGLTCKLQLWMRFDENFVKSNNPALLWMHSVEISCTRGVLICKTCPRWISTRKMSKNRSCRRRRRRRRRHRPW